MTAFLAVLVGRGLALRRGRRPAATLAAASGAAFAAVVLGQIANAFACRSTTRPVWRLTWAGNRLLLGAVAVELLVLLAMLGVPPLADVLGTGRRRRWAWRSRPSPCPRCSWPTRRRR